MEIHYRNKNGLIGWPLTIQSDRTNRPISIRLDENCTWVGSYNLIVRTTRCDQNCMRKSKDHTIWLVGRPYCTVSVLNSMWLDVFRNALMVKLPKYGRPDCIMIDRPDCSVSGRGKWTIRLHEIVPTQSVQSDCIVSGRLKGPGLRSVLHYF